MHTVASLLLLNRRSILQSTQSLNRGMLARSPRNDQEFHVAGNFARLLVPDSLAKVRSDLSVQGRTIMRVWHRDDYTCVCEEC